MLENDIKISVFLLGNYEIDILKNNFNNILEFQDVHDIEIYCYDCFLNNLTKKYLNECIKKYNNIKIIHNDFSDIENFFSYSIDISRGDYLVFISYNLFFYKGILKKLYQKSSNTNLDMLLFNGQSTFNNSNLSEKHSNFDFLNKSVNKCFNINDLSINEIMCYQKNLDNIFFNKKFLMKSKNKNFKNFLDKPNLLLSLFFYANSIYFLDKPVYKISETKKNKSNLFYSFELAELIFIHILYKFDNQSRYIILLKILRILLGNLNNISEENKGKYICQFKIFLEKYLILKTLKTSLNENETVLLKSIETEIISNKEDYF